MSELDQLRRSRGFDTREVALAKVGRLERFFRDNALDAAVVGVSGGVDSACVLALLCALKSRGILRRVVALALPIEAIGATGQARATKNAQLVARALDAELWIAPLTHAHDATIAAIESASGMAFDTWSNGQALSVARTPALYGAAALLQSHGLRSIVVGTTNRDEGAYLGFFGKASDAMVDLQPISDLHKSEVRALAAHLRVPLEIVESEPRGDVHDGRTDEQMIGASYDEVELFLRTRELGMSATHEAIERHHQKNAHKYRVGDPAVHLDVMPRGVPGGWSSERLSGRDERRPPRSALPGEWDPPRISLEPLLVSFLPRAFEQLEGVSHAWLAHEVLTASDCARLRDAMSASGRAEPVGVTGVKDSYGIGSVRATAWSPDLACALYQKLAPAIPSVRFLDEHASTDHFATDARTGHRSWRVVGLSPLLRFMRYDPGGRHLCHYDAGFDYGDGRRTLMSVVFYLTSAPNSGATRFVRDGQNQLPARDRNFADWERDTRDEEVIVAVHPKEGDALLFDHRMCHDVQRWEGPGSRFIVRADVVYEAIPDGRA